MEDRDQVVESQPHSNITVNAPEFVSGTELDDTQGPPEVDIMDFSDPPEVRCHYISGPPWPRADSEPTPLKLVWEPELDEYCHLRRTVSINFDDRLEDEDEESAGSPPPSDATVEPPDPVDDTSPNDISDSQTPYTYTEADQGAD